MAYYALLGGARAEQNVSAKLRGAGIQRRFGCCRLWKSKSHCRNGQRCSGAIKINSFDLGCDRFDQDRPHVLRRGGGLLANRGCRSAFDLSCDDAARVTTGNIFVRR